MSDTKPFNAEHAKAGAPYACRNGQEATILKWDSRQKHFPLHGVRGDADTPASWTLAGSYDYVVVMNSDDLVMLPLGHIDGKPVWADSKIITQYDCEIEALAWFRQGEPFDGSRWPEPAKQYPETQMTHDELWAAIRASVPCNFSIGVENKGAPYGTEDVTSAVANAALRHAIDAGQVVSKEDHEAGLVRLGEQLRDIAIGRNPARDMAIAEAAINACIGVFCLHEDRDRIRCNVGAAGVIATVKP